MLAGARPHRRGRCCQCEREEDKRGQEESALHWVAPYRSHRFLPRSSEGVSVSSPCQRWRTYLLRNVLSRPSTSSIRSQSAGDVCIGPAVVGSKHTASRLACRDLASTLNRLRRAVHGVALAWRRPHLALLANGLIQPCHPHTSGKAVKDRLTDCLCHGRRPGRSASRTSVSDASARILGTRAPGFWMAFLTHFACAVAHEC